MYSIQALWTAAHHKLPLTVVIANNGGYRIIKQRLLAFHGDDHYVGMDFVDPPVDFVGMARSLGLEATRVTDPGMSGDAQVRVQPARRKADRGGGRRDGLNPSFVIPGRCAASNYDVQLHIGESQDSGSGPSDHPGMTVLHRPILHRRMRRGEARAALAEQFFAQRSLRVSILVAPAPNQFGDQHIDDVFEISR